MSLVDRMHELLELYESMGAERDDGINAIQELTEPSDDVRKAEAEYRFIERLTFSEFGDIVAMMDDVYRDHFLDFPVWARNLAFRLACLLEPQNAEIRRRAAIDLRYFGPDWDMEADRLDAEADELERQAAAHEAGTREGEVH